MAPRGGQKNQVAPQHFAGKEFVRRFAKGGFDLHPFLMVRPSIAYSPVPPMMQCDDSTCRIDTIFRAKTASDFPAGAGAAACYTGRGTVPAHLETASRAAPRTCI